MPHRRPQSVQSVPSAHRLKVDPIPPSSQKASDAYPGMPEQLSVQTHSGGCDGAGIDDCANGGGRGRALAGSAVDLQRGPQSVQSVPNAQSEYVAL